MKNILLISLFTITALSFALTGDEILKKVDENITPSSIEYTGKMVISRSGKEQVKEMKVFGSGAEKAFVEFLSPPRDKGTKYLRIGDDLWMYLPGANRTVKISGHMLRQSMMGSDFSYEDQTSRNKMYEIYNTVVKEETEELYVIELTAKPDAETTYYRRLMRVNKADFSMTEQELYANSGKLLKVMTVLENTEINGKKYPSRIRMEVQIKKDSYTEIIMEDIKLDIEIDESIFSFSNLEKR
jgi:outer membrane lipoprotein-sorting protein